MRRDVGIVSRFTERVKRWYEYDIKPNLCLIAFTLWIIIGSWWWQIGWEMFSAIMRLGMVGLVYGVIFEANAGRDPIFPKDLTISWERIHTGEGKDPILVPAEDSLRLRFEYERKVKKAHIRACMTVILVVQMFLAYQKSEEIAFNACMKENSDIKPKSERVDFCTPEPREDVN